RSGRRRERVPASAELQPERRHLGRLAVERHERLRRLAEDAERLDLRQPVRRSLALVRVPVAVNDGEAIASLTDRDLRVGVVTEERELHGKASMRCERAARCSRERPLTPRSATPPSPSTARAPGAAAPRPRPPRDRAPRARARTTSRRRAAGPSRPPRRGCPPTAAPTRGGRSRDRGGTGAPRGT